MRLTDFVRYPSTNEADVLVIGAGLAGLTAAIALRAAGYRTLVVDKGRGVGGRLATRRIGGGICDHGAQFMTARDPRFAALLEEWAKAGVSKEWCRGFAADADGHPRWRGQPGMTAVAKHLAFGMDVRVEQEVTALQHDLQGWRASTKQGEVFRGRAVVLTAPVPQAIALLDASRIPIASAVRARLMAISYTRCLAAMAVLDGPSRIPPPGGLAVNSGPIAWIADNQQKGISAVPAVTVHATPEFSLSRWDGDRDQAGVELLRAAEPWLGAKIVEASVHGWKYSQPEKIDPCGFVQVVSLPPLLLAGDAFVAPRVEGAVLSGWAAAEAIKI